MVNGFTRKTRPTGAEVAAIFVLTILFFLAITFFSAWILMLLLGALAAYFGFTAPGYWVVFAGLFIFNFIVGSFKNVSTDNG